MQRELEQFAQRPLVDGARRRTASRSSGRESRSLRPRRLTVPVWSNGLPMAQTVEQLADDKVKLTVEVPAHDVHHAVEHAANDLAASARIPGFRKGKVPRPILMQRVGKERLFTEAVESHISRLVLERRDPRPRQPRRPARVRLRPARERERGLALLGHRRGAAEARARRLDEARGAEARGRRAAGGGHRGARGAAAHRRRADPGRGAPRAGAATPSSSTCSPRTAPRSATTSSSSARSGSSRRSRTRSRGLGAGEQRDVAYELADGSRRERHRRRQGD